MSLAYSIFPAEEHVRIVGKGKVTASDCIATIQRVAADPLSRPHFSVLADLRTITFDDTREIVDIAEVLEEQTPLWEGNIAIVAKGALLFPSVLLATHVRAAQPFINIKVFADGSSAETFCMKGRLSSLLPA